MPHAIEMLTCDNKMYVEMRKSLSGGAVGHQQSTAKYPSQKRK